MRLEHAVQDRRKLHEGVAVALRSLGHDALSVYEQQLQCHTDPDIATVCQQEQRT
jgi:hypothetical protein